MALSAHSSQFEEFKNYKNDWTGIPSGKYKQSFGENRGWLIPFQIMQWGLHEVVRIFWHESMLFCVSPDGWNFFFRNGELLKITLQFHKTCQNIFQNYAIFYQIYIFAWFFFHVTRIFSSIEWSKKNIKIWKLRKWRRFLWKFWKWIFSKRPPLKFVTFFGGLLIIWTT